LTVPSTSSIHFIPSTNSFHPRLQFTLELSGEKLEFLDTTIIISNRKFVFNWYRKPTFSGRFLNFHSNHPIAQKKGTIFSLVDRAFLLSDFTFHKKNLTFIINILLDNDYPLTFIFNTVNQRIKNLLKTKNKCVLHEDLVDMNVCTNESASWLTVPFIPLHTEKFKRLNSNDIRVSFRSPNKIGKYIKVQKDKCPPPTSKRNVVYKISCNNCDASYVG
ncbi:hypothetical protein ALC60_02132, partial [Trachymyrmex zeteki]